jgi:hypothetical protein
MSSWAQEETISLLVPVHLVAKLDVGRYYPLDRLIFLRLIHRNKVDLGRLDSYSYSS